jgi:hypothetical protein
MMTPSPIGGNAGLGCFVLGAGNSWNYNHSGSNVGFRCELRGFPGHQAGVVVMTNGSDDCFPGDVVSAARRTFGW